MSVNQLTFAAFLGLACFGSGPATAQSAQGQLNLGASHSSRYGSAVDLSFRGTDLGGTGSMLLSPLKTVAKDVSYLST